MKELLLTACCFLLIAFLFIACNSGNQKAQQENGKLSGTISISGAFALYPMAVKWAEEFKKLHPDVHIDISAGGAGKGIADALAGMVDLGMVSRSVSPEEEVKGAWKIGVVKDAVVAVVNAKNPVLKDLNLKGLTREKFIEIFLTGNLKQWGSCVGSTDKSAINVYTRSDACGAAEMWAKYLGAKQENLKGIGVYGDPGISDAVKRDPLGIGYNNVIYAYDINSRKPYDGLAVIPLDITADNKIDESENFYDSLDNLMKAIQDNKYPSPPARELYFVSKGKPEKKEVIEFIKWILNDGQKFVKEAGYVSLADDKIKSELTKL
jgi:phosphate transport system substrate-binding protein